MLLYLNGVVHFWGAFVTSDSTSRLSCVPWQPPILHKSFLHLAADHEFQFHLLINGTREIKIVLEYSPLYFDDKTSGVLTHEKIEKWDTADYGNSPWCMQHLGSCRSSYNYGMKQWFQNYFTFKSICPQPVRPVGWGDVTGYCWWLISNPIIML